MRKSEEDLLKDMRSYVAMTAAIQRMEALWVAANNMEGDVDERMLVVAMIAYMRTVLYGEEIEAVTEEIVIAARNGKSISDLMALDPAGNA